MDTIGNIGVETVVVFDKDSLIMLTLAILIAGIGIVVFNKMI